MGKGAQKYVTVQYQKPGHIFCCEPLMHIWVKSKENFFRLTVVSTKAWRQNCYQLYFSDQNNGLLTTYELALWIIFGQQCKINPKLLVWYFHELLLIIIKMCIRNLSASYLSAGYVRNMDTTLKWNRQHTSTKILSVLKLPRKNMTPTR